MFYIHPPSGQMALHTLEECVLTRLEYLELLHKQKTNEFSGNIEHIIEFSNYDCVGHFTLRLLAATSSDFCSFWLTRETLLFKHRLNHISARQLCRLFKNIIRQVKKRENAKSLIDSTLSDVSLHYLKSDVNHILSQNHLHDCKDHRMKVNFEHLPKMVQEKEVELSKGFAIVYCSQWKEVLLALFQTFIESETFDTEFFKELVTNDAHLIYLNQRLKFTPLREEVSCGQLSSSNINIESLKFPPCMKHLHGELRRNHRLSHYARFYYSLFLKESGMNVENALEYWKNEYSKPHFNASVCSHEWQKDARKYVYSIKHMYGLEGSRKNYRAPTCNAICRGNVNTKFEGGCPFKEFDKRKLKQLLSSSVPQSDLDEFIKIISSLQPRSACRAYLKLTCKNLKDNVTIISPVEFYLVKSAKL